MEASDLQITKSPLPEGWSQPEVVEDSVVCDGVELRRAGMASKAPSGEEITGAAAETAGSPRDRSLFELLERAALIEALREKKPTYQLQTIDGRPAGSCSSDELFPESSAPELWRYARSNGVALHADWRSAAERALWELAERDRLVRSWYGEVTPRRLELDLAATPFAPTTAYDWCAYAFPKTDGGFAPDIHVAGVFGFPRRNGIPLILGYGARIDEASALQAAMREALQLLAFLWGEPVTSEAPVVGPSAMHHLELFQYPGNHPKLRSWLAGEHRNYRPNTTHGRVRDDVQFVDLTPRWLGGGMRVAKAHSRDAAPLAFGDSPFGGHLPADLRPHPIA